MRRGGVPEHKYPGCRGCSQIFKHLIDDFANLPGPDTSPPSTQEDSICCVVFGKNSGTPLGEPLMKSINGWPSQRHHTLLVAFACHLDCAMRKIYILGIKPL